MTTTSQAAKSPSVSALAGPYGHPFHPILVTVPIGAWVSSLVFDIGSHIVSDPGFLARGAYWLIAIGVIGAVIAAGVGLLDFLVIPQHTRAFRTALTHLSLNLSVVVLFIIDFIWSHNTHGYDEPVRGGQLALTVIALIMLAASGYLGGKLAYRFGVRVASESVQMEGFDAAR